MDSKEKEIEIMYQIGFDFCKKNRKADRCIRYQDCEYCQAQALYNAGYRKVEVEKK